MDTATLTAGVFFYVIDLPLCLLFGTMGVLSLGLLTRWEDQPIGMRVFTWMWHERRTKLSPPGLLISAAGLVLINTAPVVTLMRPKNGVGVFVLVLGYFLVVTLWVALVVRAVRRRPDRG